MQTFESLTAAADDGFAVETDVRWTSVNRAVIIHDAAATRGHGAIGLPGVGDDMESAQRALPLIHKKEREVLSACDVRERDGGPGGRTRSSWVYVEVKVDQNTAQNREFVDVIRSNGLSDRTVVTSNNLDRLAEIKKLAPDLPRMLFIAAKVPASQLAHEQLWAVAVNFDVATGYISELKKAGLVVIVWTVNEEQAWEKTRSAGTDKVLTDKAECVRRMAGPAMKNCTLRSNVGCDTG